MLITALILVSHLNELNENLKEIVCRTKMVGLEEPLVE